MNWAFTLPGRLRIATIKNNMHVIDCALLNKQRRSIPTNRSAVMARALPKALARFRRQRKETETSLSSKHASDNRGKMRACISTV